MVKKITSWLILALLCFVLLEFSIFLLASFGFLNIIMPTYSMESPEDLLPERSFIYGHRHQPNSTYEVKKNCLHTHYQFNSLGFRDEDHPIKSKGPRIVVIGDSFMEGLSVSEPERLTDLLEVETRVPHLNFAMADKGSTQACIIYDSIASKYEHDAVVMALFPINDLIDDDPNIGKNENSIRPCWVGNYPNYHLQFVPETAPAQKDYSTWKHFLKTHTYTYDALFYLKESVKLALGAGKNYPSTGYFSYSDEQLNRMKYSLSRIKKKAGERPFIVFCIPSTRDFTLKDKERRSIEQELALFCAENDIEFIGLYDPLKRASNQPESDFYYSCDSHWNAQGHQAVKEITLKNSKHYQQLTSQ